MRLLLTTALCVVSLLGCSHDKPKPETKKFPLNRRAAETFGAMNTKPSLMVHQHVKRTKCIRRMYSKRVFIFQQREWIPSNQSRWKTI